MQGEFRGDFTRDTHNPQKQFLRVLMQQGRVQLDADFNEQVSILLHYLQTLATDLIGPHGGPATATGFDIKLAPQNSNRVTDLMIGPGRYYVEGLLCENTHPGASYENQPYLPIADNYEYPELPFLVYLDVWERHVDSTHAADPDHNGSIREVALGGPDTATRAQIVWQVKHTDQLVKSAENRLEEILALEEGTDSQESEPGGSNGGAVPGDATGEETNNNGETIETPVDEPPADQASPVVRAARIFRTNQQALSVAASPEIVEATALPRLKAKALENSNVNGKDPCTIAPNARYRGAENQLYRVEIHSGGNEPTFKWSRENSAVAFPIVSAVGSLITLEHLGYDSRFGLQENDWVEVIDDDYVYLNQPGKLIQIQKIDQVTQQITLSEPPEGGTGSDRTKHPCLRRWDHQAGNPSYGGSAVAPDGALPVKIAADPSDPWQTLEDGVQIQFQPGTYRPGDYWLIPARTATGDIEWPKSDDSQEPQAILPHGVKHYYAPLALIAQADEGIQILDCRHQFAPLPNNAHPVAE